MLYDPHLDLFLQVAELGSFSKAADAGFITPSAVIKQINLLEDKLGVRLFERTHRGVKLTKSGESLKKDAPKLIRLSHEVASRAVSAMNCADHVIRIGTSPMTPAGVLVELWPKLSERVPGLNEDVQTDEASLIPDTEKETEEQSMTEHYTTNTKIEDVINDRIFGDYGRLIFPVDSGYYGGSTLGNLSLTWYNYIDSDKTVEICNYMRNQEENGNTIFYDIYTEAEKAADPAKRDTGLFFFKGNPGTKFAIVNAGGGFAYVGAMHDSFPHVLELSKMGYNAFALIYRPGAQTACEDLSRAIAFIYWHADELQVDTDGYSLWGGSAGGRMADWVGTYGTKYFGEKAYPPPAAVIVNYTGLSEVTGYEPPTYSAVGTSDGIASWRTMKSRLDTMSKMGIPTEFHSYDGLPHGFGLGTGTVAEGWINDAVAFWEDQM